MHYSSILLAFSAAIFGTAAPTYAVGLSNVYQGQQVAAVLTDSPHQVAAIELLVSDVLSINRHTDSENQIVHVRGTPESIEKLRELGFDVSVVNHDLLQFITDSPSHSQPPRQQRDASFHSGYHSYDEIIAYLKSLSKISNGPALTYAEMSGATAEGRKLPTLAIGNASAPYAMYLQGNLHAREWIGSASLLYATEQLISSYNSSPYANKIRLYISPMANPDGYEYTRTVDRLWRGNRSKNGGCDGVDLNRNFNGFNSWRLGECGTIYGGPAPFSELETQSISTFLKAIKTRQRLVGIIDFHNFAQWIMWPPGYAGAPAQMPDGKNLAACGNAIKNAIQKTSGQVYSATTANDFYSATGAFDDWSYDALSQSPNPKAAVDKGLVYTIELPPIDGSSMAGFIVPPEDIVPVGKQVLTAIDTAAKYIMANNVPK